MAKGFTLVLAATAVLGSAGLCAAAEVAEESDTTVTQAQIPAPVAATVKEIWQERHVCEGGESRRRWRGRL